MSERIPSAPVGDRYDYRFMARFIEAVKQELGLRLRRDTANASILLRSPGGVVYEITVDDAGVVTSTYVQG